MTVPTKTNSPATWVGVSLDQIVDVVYGKALRSDHRAGSGGIPVYASSGVVGEHDVALHQGPSIVIGRKGAVGATHFAPGPFWCIDTAFYLDNVNPFVDLEYLAHALDAQNLLRLSITVAIPGISRTDLERVQIPLPPLSEQKRIAAILREADALRRERRRANERAGDLLPALLHIILADDNNNLGSITLGSLATTAYGTSKKASENSAKGVPVLRIPNVVSGRLDYDDMKYVELTKKELQSLSLDTGDVLVVRSNGNPNNVGRATAYINDGVSRTYASYLIRIRADREQVDPEFLADYLNQSPGRSQLLNRISMSAGQSNVNSQALAAIEVPLLVSKARQKYLDLRAEIFEYEAEYATADRSSNDLFNSLLIRAFTGDLTAVWRETHDEQLREEAVQRDIALGLRGTEPTIGDLEAGLVTRAEQEEANHQLVQALEQFRALPSNVFQGMLAETLGDLSKFNVSSLLGTNAQALQAMQFDMGEFVASQISPVTQRFAEQFADSIRNITQLHAETLRLPMLHPSSELTRQLASWFTNVGRLGTVLEVLKTREALRDALTDELGELLDRIASAPTYFRPEILVDDDMSLIQAEERMRLLVALGIVRPVVVRGQPCYRLVSSEREYAAPEGLDYETA